MLLGPPGTLVSHRAAAALAGVGGRHEPRPEVSIPSVDVAGGSESGVELVVLDAILDAALPRPVRQLDVCVGGHRYRLDSPTPR